MVFDVLESRVYYRLALYKILAIYRGAIYVYCNNLLAKQAAEVIISKPPEAENLSTYNGHSPCSSC